MSIAGAVVAATGTAVSAVAAHNNAQQQAALQRSNAIAQQRDAQWATQQAAYNENVTRQQTARLRGQQTAAVGASGISFDGTPLDLLEETTINGEMQALAERRQGQFQSDSSLFGAAGSLYQANATAAAGQTQLTTGLITAAGQAVGGAGGALANYNNSNTNKLLIASRNNAGAYAAGTF